MSARRNRYWRRIFSLQALGVVAIALALALGMGHAETLRVGGAGGHATLAAAVRRAEAGDTILLSPGVHLARDLSLPFDLTLEGEGKATLRADGAVQKGILVPAAGTVITVRGLTFEGARAPDLNGAGIRFEGTRLAVISCTFRDNENGILATGDAGGGLSVTASRFENNGHGDGYSHGIYQSRGRDIEVADSTFIGTRIGHHIKTLAARVVVRNNRFDDTDGSTSYVVDVTAGGRVFIEGNEIRRQRSASQEHIFNYDTTRGGVAGTISITGNTIITARRGTRLLRNPENLPAQIAKNDLQTDDGGNWIGLPADAVVRPQPRDASPAARAVAAPEAPHTAPTSIAPDEAARRAAALARLTPQQRRAVAPLITTPVASPGASGDAPPTPPRDGTLSAPSFPALVPGEVAQLKLVRLRANGSPVLTMGFVLPRSALPAEGTLAAFAGTRALPVQLDIKARHTDGSFRHGSISISVPPDLPAGTRIVLRRGVPAAPAETNFAMPPLQLRVDSGIDANVDLTAALTNKGTLWLDGPLVREQTVRLKLSSLLTLATEFRANHDGTGRLRLTFENTKTFAPDPRDLSYRFRVASGDETLHLEAVRGHYRNSAFTLTVPVGAPPAFGAIQDPKALIAAGAVPPLAQHRRVTAAGLPRALTAPRPGVFGPLTPYMGTTGGRVDIGPMTAYSAAWALTQAPEARAAMLYVADIGLTIPWHFEDDATGLPVRVDRRPKFWADARGAEDAAGADRFPASLFAGNAGGWATDTAHKPELAYPAYLATGEIVYARALAHEAAYVIAAVWPELRGPESLLLTRDLQVRSLAWSLRTVANAAYILPDTDKSKAYFIRALRANIDDLQATYLAGRQMADAGETEGYLRIDAGRDPRAIAPWQNDFLAIVLAVEVARETRGALPVLDWMTAYIAGRVLAPGADLGVMAGQRHVVLDPRGRRYTTWAEVFAASRSAYPDEVYTGSGDGGYGVLRAALGAIVATTGDDRARAALTVLRAVPDAAKLDEPTNELGRGYRPQFSLE